VSAAALVAVGGVAWGRHHLARNAMGDDFEQDLGSGRRKIRHEGGI
jgi:hypothetical protein